MGSYSVFLYSWACSSFRVRIASPPPLASARSPTRRRRENFGPGASSSTAAMATGARRGSTGGGGSLFLLELQGALAALQADHFARIAALRTPCAEVRVSARGFFPAICPLK